MVENKVVKGLEDWTDKALSVVENADKTTVIGSYLMEKLEPISQTVTLV